MAIAYRAAGTTSKVQSGNMAPGLPAGHALNDILILQTNQQDNVACSVSGWTNIAAGIGNNGTNDRVELWAKRDNGSESAPTVTHAAGGISNATIYALSGVDPSLTIGVGAGAIFRDVQKQNGTDQVTFTAPALTGVISGDMRMFLGGFTVNDTSGVTTNNWGTVSGFTEDKDDASDLLGAWGVSFAADHVLATGAAGSITSAVGWTGAFTSWTWICTQLALSSDVVGGGATAAVKDTRLRFSLSANSPRTLLWNVWGLLALVWYQATGDVALRFSLTASAFKDVGLRFALSVGGTQAFQDIALRFRLSVLAFKDVALRFRLSALTFKDIALRFELSAQAFKDIALRFRLSAQSFKDIALRFGLAVRAFKDLALRFRLSAQTFKDVALRFSLAARTFKDVQLRFVLAVRAFKDVQLRFRLSASAFKDIALRFSLSTTYTFKDIALRMRLSARTFKDTALRFGLAVRAYKDVGLRARLSAQGFRDIALRARLSARAFFDVGLRFRLGVRAFKDVALRARISGRSFADVALRFSLSSGLRRGGALVRIAVLATGLVGSRAVAQGFVGTKAQASALTRTMQLATAVVGSARVGSGLVASST